MASGLTLRYSYKSSADYGKRALCEWARVYVERLRRGEGDEKVAKVIGIHVLNFASLDSSKAHHVFHLKEHETGLQHFQDIELHTIELEKFCSPREEWEFSDLVARTKSSLDIWLAFLMHHDLLQRENLPPPLDNPALQKAMDVLEVMNFKPKERETYEGQEKLFLIQMSALKKQFEKGKAAGLKAAREKYQKEKVEKEKRQTALSMLKEGMNAELISKVTGLSVPEIRNLLFDESAH